MGACLADNVFTNDPVESFIADLKEPPTKNYRASIDTIASRTRVPANFLMAFSELAPGKTDQDRTRAAQMIADKIAPRIRNGEKIEDVVRSISGENAQAASRFIERAYQIADEHYTAPDQAKEEPGLVQDIGTQAKATTQQVGAGLARGIGTMAEEIATKGAYWGPPTAARRLGNAIGDDLSAKSQATRQQLSKETLDAIAASSPDGNIFKPSTWSFGADPSIRGVSFLTMDVLGSLLPVVATAVATRSPSATAAVGGAMGGGDAASTAHDIVLEASKAVDENGVSLLEKGSPYYRALREAGRTPEEALDLTLAAAEKTAFMMTAPVSAFGGAATQKIIAPAGGAIVKAGPLARALGTAGLSALEEGAQEATETIAARYGTQSATGMELDLTSGTFGDFILGALGGAIPGAVSGVAHGDGREEQPDSAAQQDGPLALPAPRLGLPSPPKLLPAPGDPSAPSPKPNRPLKKALDVAPDKILPGVDGEVTVRAGDLPPFVGTVYKDNGIILTIADENGEFIDISRQQIESGEATIESANSDIQDVNTPTVEGPAAPAQDQAQTDTGATTADEARRLLDVLNTQAKEQGWTKRRLAKKQELEATIASYNPTAGGAEPAVEASPSETAPTAPDVAAPDGEATPAQRFVGTFDQQAEDSDQTMTVSVTDKGPWDFNDTWPAPDPDKLAAREQEGRIDFLDGEGPESVVSTLTETLGEMTAEMGFARQWEDQVAKIRAGQKPDFRVKKGEDALKIAEGNVAEAKRNVENIDAALRDIWSDEAVDAMGAEIAKTLDGQARAPKEAPTERQAPEPSKSAKMDNLDKTQPQDDTPEQIAPENIISLKGGKGYRGEMARFIVRGDDKTGWSASIDYDIQGFAGGMLDTGPNKVATRDEAIREAGRRLRRQIEDIADGRGGSAASPRHVKDAQKIVRWATGFAGAETTEPAPKKSTRTKAPAPTGTDGTGAEAAAQPAPDVTGSYRLDQSLSDAHCKALAKYRDTDGGELVGEMDNALRRIADQRRRGDNEQYRLLMAEGEQISRSIIADLRKKKGVIDFPSRDEDTGEWESDGSPAGNAFDWLDQVESNGIAIDASDHAGGDGKRRAPGEVDMMPEKDVFPAVSSTVNLDKEGRASGEISIEEAQARVAEWKRIAAEIGKSGRNKDKIVVSLFDYTGAWSQPWVDAGYQVLRFDIKTGSDILSDDFFWNRLSEIREEGKEVYGVLSATPCTTFAGSGARWWEGLHDKESPEAVAKVFGERALTSGAKSPLEYNLMLVRASRDAIAHRNGREDAAAARPLPSLQLRRSLHEVHPALRRLRYRSAVCQCGPGRGFQGTVEVSGRRSAGEREPQHDARRLLLRLLHRQRSRSRKDAGRAQGSATVIVDAPRAAPGRAYADHPERPFRRRSEIRG